VDKGYVLFAFDPRMLARRVAKNLGQVESAGLLRQPKIKSHKPNRLFQFSQLLVDVRAGQNPIEPPVFDQNAASLGGRVVPRYPRAKSEELDFIEHGGRDIFQHRIPNRQMRRTHTGDRAIFRRGGPSGETALAKAKLEYRLGQSRIEGALRVPQGRLPASERPRDRRYRSPPPVVASRTIRCGSRARIETSGDCFEMPRQGAVTLSDLDGSDPGAGLEPCGRKGTHRAKSGSVRFDWSRDRLGRITAHAQVSSLHDER
jgi:hypothetical protein